MMGMCRLDTGCFRDLAGADAPGARPDILRLSVHHRADALQVWQPAPFGHVMSVGDITAGHRALAADFTSLRHRRVPPQGPLYRGGIEYHRMGRFASFGDPAVRVFFASQTTMLQSCISLANENFFSKDEKYCAQIKSPCERIVGRNRKCDAARDFFVPEFQ